MALITLIREKKFVVVVIIDDDDDGDVSCKEANSRKKEVQTARAIAIIII